MRFFVLTEHGQKVDTVALTGNSIGQARIDDLVGTVLDAMSVVSFAIATAAVAFIALIRRRRGLALTVLLLIAGANVTTQVPKDVIERPYPRGRPRAGRRRQQPAQRAHDGRRVGGGRAGSGAAAADAGRRRVPRGRVRRARRGRDLSAGWHRPSDAIAALLVVGGVDGRGLLRAAAGSAPRDRVERRDAHPARRRFCSSWSGWLCSSWRGRHRAHRPGARLRPGGTERRRLFAAYAGGAAGIAGTAALLVGLLLLTVHRVVPHRMAAPPPSQPQPQPAPEPEPPTVVLRDPAAEAPTVRIGGADDPTIRNPNPPG